MTENESLMPADSRGRVRVPEDRREALLDEFERSGMSGAKFAALVGVKYPTFAVWVQKRRKSKGQTNKVGRPMPFAEAVLDINLAGVAMAGAGLVIELPGGGRVIVQSPVQLQMAAELLRMISTGSRVC